MNGVRWATFSADEDTVVVLSGLAAVIVVLVAGAVGAALARDDSGMHQFFAGSGGGGGPGPRAIAPEPSFSMPPLTIRRGEPERMVHREPKLKGGRFAHARSSDTPVRIVHHDRNSPALAALPPLPPIWDGPTARDQPAIVALYRDRTLRRGDAVMTQQGIRIFAGSSTFPFRPEDFRTVASFRQKDVPFRKALMDIDRLPTPG